MTTLPRQDSIDWVMSLGGVTHQQAVALLKKHNNDADRAVNDFLDNGERAFLIEQPNNTWEHADNLPSFHINPDDTGGSSVRGALSRPPSRASYRNEPIDLTAEHAAADASKVLSLQEQQDLEDAELQRAIALSKQDDPSTQENGITGTGQQFGPATAAHYDYSKWAMTKSTAITREIFEHPRPSKRRRISDEPVFLRGSKETAYLAPLLTIYHSIPLAREALLFPSMKVHAYGHDPNWWSGTSDENFKSVSVENPTGNNDLENVLCEVQSLMGFLDNTNRAYGSVEALANLRAFSSTETQFLNSHYINVWKTAAMKQQPEDQLTQIFSSVAFKDTGNAGAGFESRTFHIVDLVVQRNEGQSLYDLLDCAVWVDTSDTPMEDVWIDHCAEVFTMRLFSTTKDKTGLGVKIPANFYPDRYLDECRQVSWDMRRGKQEMKSRKKQLSNQQARLHGVYKPNRVWVPISLTLSVAKEAATVAVRDKILPNGTHEEMQPLLAERSGISQSQLQDCEADLQNTIVRIAQKWQEIEDRKKEIENECRDISLRLTQQSPNPDDPPHHKYILQGVSTLPHITYVRRPVTKDLIEFDDEESGEDQTPPPWQWWRISFSGEDAPSDVSLPVAGPVTEAEAKAATVDRVGPSSDWSRKVQQPSSSSGNSTGYSIRKVREYEVLKAAREESDEVILVYANENAMRFRGSSLSGALKGFVDKDNQAFANELRREQAEQELGTVNSSQDTENQIVFEDVPLNRPPELGSSLSREMTPMSMSSPKREMEGDEQPSPKRPKSSDDQIMAETESDDPPPYHAITNGLGPAHEMQERSDAEGLWPKPRPSRIGQHAEKMLERIGEDEGGVDGHGKSEVIHIEHSTTPLR